uniref:CheD chemotaxis protein n=1 Tax=Borely moumouvirus TaxID=2712067 RepID=A0A6G6AAP7_9VIRU
MSIYSEKYHDNCHDYLKKIYLEKYAQPKYKKFLYEVKKYIPKLNICVDTDYDQYGNVIVCDQHAVIFGHHQDIFPILATYALNACIGLIMYCPKYKVAALAHIDGLPGYSFESAIDDGVKVNFDPVYENIGIILKNIRNICKTREIIDIDYYLIGGIFGLSEVMIFDITQCLNKYGGGNYKFNFIGRNLLGPDNQSRNICFNTITGEITYFDFITNSEYYGSNLNKKNLPINIIKAPRKSEALLDITYLPIF